MGISSRNTRFVRVCLVTALLGAFLMMPTETHAVSFSGRLFDEGPAEFSSPWGIATDEFGDIYVTDENKHQLVKFDGSTWSVEWVAGSAGSEAGQLYFPSGLAVGDGLIFVADTGNHRIATFTYEGAWASEVRGTGEFAFSYPADVDFHNGRLYVSEGGARCRIQIIRKSGSTYALEKAFGGCGSQPGQFTSPGGVAVTDDHIFVSDQSASVVKRFSYTGGYESTIGSPGVEPGQLNGPDGIAATKTDAGGTFVWVVEAGTTSRAQKFTADGELVTVLTGTGHKGFTFPHGLALSPTGDQLYIADTSGEDPNVYAFLESEPKLFVYPEDNLKRLTRTEGIWFRMAYNQATKTCTVLAKATVTVPGHPKFTVEDDFKVPSVADDFKIDVSDKQAKWMKRADAANKKVVISAVFRGNCAEGAKVTANKSYKAG